MPITPLPTPPSRNDPTNFSSRADAFLGALPAFGTEANALAVDVNDDAVAAAASASTATTQAGIATTQAGLATAQVGLATTQAGIATTKAGEAAASAIAADASAQAAAAMAASFAGTSTSSVAVGLGEKTFVTQSGEQYTAGIFVTVVSSASPSNFMFGQVVSYTGSSLVVNIQSTGGSGTYSSWNISLAGVRGAPGTGITDQAIGFTAAGGTTARTLTVDVDITASALATLTGAQTLTNKTIAFGSNTLTGVQPTLVSGTNIKTVNGASVLGSGDISAGADVIRVGRTSNTQMVASNKGNLIAITSGTFTQTFDACASLGNGWFVYIQNSGTGDITLDPSGSETIDGLTSYIMYPGEVRLVQCDGSALRSIVLNAFYRTFTASGTFTKPPGYTAFQGFLWGAGGGGSKGSDVSFHSGGGGGGACVTFALGSSFFGASETITIGSGGVGPTANATDGAAGGNSSVGAIVTSYGGGGGTHGNNSQGQGNGGGGGGWMSAGGNGGYGNFGGTGGNPVGETRLADILVGNVGFGGGLGPSFNSYLKAGVYGGGGGGSVSSAGGTSLYGGGGGGSNQGLTAGTSTYGGSGGAGTSSTSGVNGNAPGGGGGATRTGTKAGDGGRGELRIWGII